MNQPLSWTAIRASERSAAPKPPRFIPNTAAIICPRDGIIAADIQDVQIDGLRAGIRCLDMKLVAGVHRRFFSLGDSGTRVGISADNAAATLRATLEAINPNLAKRVPNGVLNVATNITESKSIDDAAHAARLIRWLYIPVGLLGAFLMFLVFVKSRDPVHSVRYGGFSLMIGGALLIGLGEATPVFAKFAGDQEAGRGKAVAAFVHGFPVHSRTTAPSAGPSSACRP